MGFTTISSSYFFSVYGELSASNAKTAGTNINGDLIHCAEAPFPSFHSINPNDKYRIFVPCSSSANRDLARRFFSVLCLSRTLPSVFISPIVTGSEADKFSKSERIEKTRMSVSLSTER